MSFRTHVLACMFGMGSWVAINGMWVELPLIVPYIPESWHLPAYLTVLIQVANVGPLLVTLLHRFRPGVVNERAVIYAIAAVGCLACLLLAFLWHYTVEVAGGPHSVPLLALTFFLSVVDCTSSVTFLPFMMHLQSHYLTTYFIGEGLSGLVPALAALVQGVGVVHCHNATQKDNRTRVNASEAGLTLELEAHYQPANFSTQTFFIFLTAMMVASMWAFHLLNRHPSVRQEHMGNGYLAGQKEEPGLRLQSPLEPKPMITPVNCHQGEQRSAFGTGTYSTTEMLFIFVVLAWVNALTNTVLPSVQTYSCLPYGNKAYHLAAAMGALANPLACFIAMFVPIRSLMLMGFLTLTGTGIGAYIMFIAAMSPCPLLVHSASGTVHIVAAWILFVLTLSYVKVIIGVILRDEGHSALVWCGAVVQLGSMLGALTMFPLPETSCRTPSSDQQNVSGMSCGTETEGDADRSFIGERQVSTKAPASPDALKPL